MTVELGSKPQHRRPQELEAAGSRAGSGAGSSGAGNEPEKGEGRAELAGGDVRVQRRPWLAKQRGGGRWRRSRNVVRRRQRHDVGRGRQRDDTTRTPWQGGGELEAERREEEARARGGRTSPEIGEKVSEMSSCLSQPRLSTTPVKNGCTSLVAAWDPLRVNDPTLWSLRLPEEGTVTPVAHRRSWPQLPHQNKSRSKNRVGDTIRRVVATWLTRRFAV